MPPAANETQSGGAIRDILQGKKPDSCGRVSAFLEEGVERWAEWCGRNEREAGRKKWKQQALSTCPALPPRQG